MATNILQQVEIKYSRETRDYDIYVGGEFIGSAATYGQAEDTANEYLTQLAELEARAVISPDLPPVEVLAETAAELAETAQLHGDTRNRNALNKAMFHLHAGVKPTQTVGGYLVQSGTRGGMVHRVSHTHGCTCEAAAKGFACWHSAMVEIITVSQERAMPQVSAVRSLIQS